ncbi:TetR/AcrR family transcriptional regulator [Solirubrobacter sp. CPCC 204708]|uniref:TetR/AcrR family transcriptional regulator n=1 Tax=Solirubrobacter deserti TaxID=2282478 RepID=A0ABT4RE43_9ACTN|nr:TetR/AcrR family transcriptional regulator [Solirubrobacter deserti]MBE2316040.1 TetR/AcrR family transcriptional regulator [Solirubrobacter deserti]MDA0136792.1 TetR/AcrR family transcriptional regulator [Solirubrobacter deserti]
MRGREAEARRNDERVLQAALEVYARDPAAPMSAVARRAGVGQATLYRRYRSKEELLARVCEDGMERIRDAALAAAGAADPFEAIAGFLRWYRSSGTTQLSSLLGMFEPVEAQFVLAREGNEAVQALVDRAVAAGTMRADVSGADLSLLVAGLAGMDERYLELVLQALALVDAPPLPGRPLAPADIERPWRDAMPDGT